MPSLLPFQIATARRRRIFHRMLLRRRSRSRLHRQPDRLLHGVRQKQQPDLRRPQSPQRLLVYPLHATLESGDGRHVQIPGLLLRTHLRCRCQQGPAVIQLHERDGHVCRALCGGCSSKGYAYAGADYGRESWCANALANALMPLANSSCSMLCPGNKAEYCGAGSKLSVWKRD